MFIRLPDVLSTGICFRFSSQLHFISFSLFWLTRVIILTRIRARSCLFEHAHVFSRDKHLRVRVEIYVYERYKLDKKIQNAIRSLQTISANSPNRRDMRAYACSTHAIQGMCAIWVDERLPVRSRPYRAEISSGCGKTQFLLMET